MLTEKQFDDYIKDLGSQLRAAESQLEKAKADINAVRGALQAAAYLKELNSKTGDTKEAAK